MKNESNGQHIIFIIILIFILSLSYCSIPLPESVKSTHKISKKMQTKTAVGEISIVEKSTISKPETVSAPSDKVPVLPQKTDIKELKVQVRAEPKKKESHIDIIPMNNPLYKTHKKGIVQFTHENHAGKYSIACGRCHHDETGKPLDLTFNDTPKGCIECHKGTEAPKGEKLGEKEKVAKYHFEALHANCIGCHKDYNTEKGDAKGKGPAPTSCTKCHPKE